jgi:hypothetical protein
MLVAMAPSLPSGAAVARTRADSHGATYSSAAAPSLPEGAEFGETLAVLPPSPFVPPRPGVSFTLPSLLTVAP